MHSKLAWHIIYHITGLNFELIRPRTVKPEQHCISIKRRYVLTTVQNPRCSEIQQDRYSHFCFHLHKGFGMLYWLSIISKGCPRTLVWQLWLGPTRAKLWLSPCAARSPDSTPPHFCREPSNHLLLFWTLRQKFISARNKCQSEGISLPCSTSPLQGSARELLQFAFSAARLAKIRARSTQTPHKWGHIADHTLLPIPALFIRDEGRKQMEPSS